MSDTKYLVKTSSDILIIGRLYDYKSRILLTDWFFLYTAADIYFTKDIQLTS